MRSKGAIEVLKLLSVGLGILVFGMGLGAFIARGQAPDWNPDRSLVPGLRCLDGDQDLGAVYQTDDLQIQFHLVNEDKDETFKVTSLHGGCACTTVEPESLQLDPGANATVTAHVDLDGAFPSESLPKEFSEVVLGLGTTALGDTIPLKMAVRCVVQPSYEISSGPLSFGEVVRGDTPEKGILVECLSPQAVPRMAPLSTPRGVEVTLEPSGGSGKRFRLTTRVKPDAPYGPLNGRIRFRAELASGPFATGSIGLTGVVVDDVYSLPSAVLLGAVPRGKSELAIVTLRSHHGETFEVIKVQPSCGSLAVRPFGLHGGGQRFAISYTGDSSASVEESIAFTLRAGSGRQQVLELSIRGYAFSGIGED